MIDWIVVILAAYMVVTFISDIMILADGFISPSEMLNPITIYKETRVNVFGCIMLTIFGHFVMPWVAPFYWFYKLCTVGRR